MCKIHVTRRSSLKNDIGYRRALSTIFLNKECADMKDILDIILDEDNKENIVLQDENGKECSFEQVAVIVYGEKDEKKLYAILLPLDEIEEINEGEGIVFRVDKFGDGHALIIEDDKDVVIGVFKEYYKLLEESGVDISDLPKL